MKSSLLIGTLIALSGCAGSYTEPSLSADHPASAAANDAPSIPRRYTLDLATADPVTPAQAGAGMNHAGHDEGDTHKHVPQPSDPGAEAGPHRHDSPSATPPPKGAAVMYTCPMHPEITSDKPDQRCPKCGMKLKAESGGPK
jgi:hypothetical protein